MINVFLASDSTILADPDDFEFPDWIEIAGLQTFREKPPDFSVQVLFLPDQGAGLKDYSYK